ncbi:MAG: hypothetical protein WC389_03525 [Lutibacter sp.]|jgi:hypothetical protein
MNEYYLIYAHSKGLTGDDCLEKEKLDYPSASMMNFIIWSMENLSEFRNGNNSPIDHEKYREFLIKKYDFPIDKLN